MPEPQTIAKAELQEIKWDNNQQVVELEKKVRVQFNPDSLKVAYSNQLGGGDQGKKAAVQFVSKSTTKLTLDLWFDVTVDPDDRAPGAPNDVRLLTREVSYFITPKKDPKQKNPVPPGVRFAWGSFLFDGIMESLNESLEALLRRRPAAALQGLGQPAQPGHSARDPRPARRPRKRCRRRRGGWPGRSGPHAAGAGAAGRDRAGRGRPPGPSRELAPPRRSQQRGQPAPSSRAC